MSHVIDIMLADGVLSWAYDGPGTSFRIETSEVGASWDDYLVVDADRTLPSYLPAKHRYQVNVDPAPIYRVTPEAVGWSGGHAYVAADPAAVAVCTILGFVLGVDGQPASGVRVRVSSATAGSYPMTGTRQLASTVSAEDGSWQLTLPQGALVTLETDADRISFTVPLRDASTLADVAPGVGGTSRYSGRAANGIFSGHTRRF